MASLLIVLGAVAGLAIWAQVNGFVALTGSACTQEGYDPMPSYEQLVNDYGKSPYCARVTRGEAWF